MVVAGGSSSAAFGDAIEDDVAIMDVGLFAGGVEVGAEFGVAVGMAAGTWLRMASAWGRYQASTAGDIAAVLPPMRNARSVFRFFAAAVSDATAADDLRMTILT